VAEPTVGLAYAQYDSARADSDVYLALGRLDDFDNQCSVVVACIDCTVKRINSQWKAGIAYTLLDWLLYIRPAYRSRQVELCSCSATGLVDTVAQVAHLLVGQCGH